MCARSFTRDYTIHLRITVPGAKSLDEIDEIVQNVVDASSAREAQTGINYALAVDPDWGSVDLENFYLVSATRPEGGIE